MRVLRFFALAFLLLGCGGIGSAESKALEESFSTYRAAILDGDGATAARHVSRSTLDQYQKYVDWSLKADRETLQSLSAMEKVSVFSMKLQVPHTDLKQMNGREAFVYAVGQGWVGQDAGGNLKIDSVEGVGSHAVAVVSSDDTKGTLRFHFAKEEGLWKLDLVKAFGLADQVLKLRIQQTDLTEDEFVIQLLESTIGEKIPDSIWEPIGE